MTWTWCSTSRPASLCSSTARCSRMAEPLLKVDDLRAGYAEAVVVQGVSLVLEPGQSLALLGRNGTGKTTLLNTLVGVTRRHGGRITLAGQDITSMPPH